MFQCSLFQSNLALSSRPLQLFVYGGKVSSSQYADASKLLRCSLSLLSIDENKLVGVNARGAVGRLSAMGYAMLSHT